jgi:hypothetical protein
MGMRKGSQQRRQRYAGRREEFLWNEQHGKGKYPREYRGYREKDSSVHP